MSILNSKFDILRGWPNGSAVAEDLVIGVPSNDSLHTGDWVRLDPAGAGYAPVDEARTAKDASLIAGAAHANIEAPELWGLVIEGRDEYSAQASGRITVLLGGGYIVRLWNDPDKAAADQMFDEALMAPGRPVTLLNGQIVDAGIAAGEAVLPTTTQIFGYCLKVVGAGDNATCDLYISL